MPQVKRKKADSARKELAAQRGAGGARVEDGAGGGRASGRTAAPGGGAAAKLRNPKAFVYSGRGKAKKAASRTAEREQRRMHGEGAAPLQPPGLLLGATAPQSGRAEAASVIRHRPRELLSEAMRASIIATPCVGEPLRPGALCSSSGRLWSVRAGVLQPPYTAPCRAAQCR